MANPFTAHPNSVGQGYWQHCGFALQVAVRTLVIAVLSVVHALLPFLATAAAGDRLLALADEVRAARARMTNV